MVSPLGKAVVSAPITPLPPRHHLTQVVLSLAVHLPRQMEGLLQHGRFAQAAAALARLADSAYVDDAVAGLAEDEAARLAGLLLERWRHLGDPILEPIAAIVAPAEIWTGAEPVRVAVEVLVLGTEPGWEAVWDGTTSASGARAVLVADPETAVASCRAHVRARTATGRVALVATARILVRRPKVTVRDDGRRIVVLDQQGRPAVGVVLQIGEVEHRTGPGGLAELETPAPRGAPLRVQGIAAGKIPDET